MNKSNSEIEHAEGEIYVIFIFDTSNGNVSMACEGSDQLAYMRRLIEAFDVHPKLRLIVTDPKTKTDGSYITEQMPCPIERYIGRKIPKTFFLSRWVTFLFPNFAAIMKIEVKFLHGSDEFQVIERDDVVMSGTVRVPDSKAIGIYLDKDSPNAETAEIPTDFEGRDLYKDFRLKGFEYGPAFQLLIGANSDGKT